MRKLHKPFGVVINRAGIGNDDVENYCVDERIDIISKIPFNKEIAQYYSQGELAFNKVEVLKKSLDEVWNYLNLKANRNDSMIEMQN